MKRILIVDDDKAFVEIAKSRLEEKGYSVSFAYDGHSGIEKARREKPDLLVLDIMLPKVNGYEISRLLKFDIKYQNIPIILFSSRDEGSSGLSRESGADAYVAKSSDAEELFEKIELLLGASPKTRPAEAREYPFTDIAETGYALINNSPEELKADIRRLVAISEIGYGMNREFEIESCIKLFIERVSEIMNAEVSSIMLLDKKKEELVIRMAKGVREEVIKNTKLKLGEGIAGRVAKEARPILIEDMGEYPYLKTREGRSYRTRSFISIPLKVNGEVLGVVNVTDKSDNTSFTKDDLKILTSISDNASFSIRNSMLYDELRKINEIKSDFLSTLSHELKNPLINVKGYIDMLLKKSQSKLGADEIKFLKTAGDNIDRLKRLVDDLLDISKMESGRIPMRRQRINLDEILRRVSNYFEPALANKKIGFSLNIAPVKDEVWGDADRIEQVLENLLGNAVKFTPERGNIGLLLEDKGEDIRFSVSDTGPGLSEGDRGRIFDKFSSLSFDKGDIVKGTGLGLSIAKDIVSLHSGSIWVESEPNKGSKFFVELPKDLRKKERS